MKIFGICKHIGITLVNSVAAVMMHEREHYHVDCAFILKGAVRLLNREHLEIDLPDHNLAEWHRTGLPLFTRATVSTIFADLPSIVLPTFTKTVTMPHAILLEDWTSYDNRKIKNEKDPAKFSCADRWEVEYLADKLKKHYPLKSPQVILHAIQHCCSQVKAPHPREKFIACVVGNFVSE